ncbi:membrane protein [Breznakia sp. PF5-3]|uniref:YihY/virulence factor BrkB family protein n=1 Tax=unclassified Breznakia TaxID=2623764 RepID=UPI002406A0C9|nr:MULTISPECIES: YihY/virulence factor BrkB family protein [unclassified Breznakia]MDF9824012.1 membrane protein [Breznakia sp. PM6-1]MDF9834811.1 membrane protein [Breznakia sp. PF5-3]MDF9838130.1 membrane protein [Breznakia sp. PFB2-8]MDF9860116.1 membrane protein [Breznakia sp. PH5-24]
MQKFKLVLQQFSSFEGSLFRYSLAFSFLLALFPVLIVIVMLFHNSVLDVGLLLDYLYHFVPEKLIEDFVVFIMDKNYPSTLTLILSLVAALNLASRSIFSFMMISAKNESYNIPKLFVRVKSYILFIVLVVSVGFIGVLASFFNYPASVTFGIGLFVLFYILYRTLTFEKRPLHFGIIGAIFSTVSIMLASQLFLLIVDHFTSYQNIYGPMASLVIALLSIYLIASLIYFGYCLNWVYGPCYPERTYKHEKLYDTMMDIISNIKKKIKGIIKR